MRGAGGCGTAAAGGVAGRGVLGAAGGAGAEAAIDGAAGAGGVTTGVGGAAGRGGGATPAGAAGGAGGATGTAGFSAAGGIIVGRAAAAGVCGTWAGGADGTAGAAGFGGGVTTVGLGGATGGATGRGGGGAAAASFFCVIAFSTSPGREICERSILVLISSSPRSVRAERADGDCASDEPRMWARTFSASCSSNELEWVFFSVTPTRGSASRMALLLTSSSLARSLIRTLLIRPFCFPALC
jgi:hypothetical protein